MGSFLQGLNILIKILTTRWVFIN